MLETQEGKGKEKMNEQEKQQAICFWLIKQLREFQGDELKITQENVTFHGENIGDYEIIVKKVKGK